MDDLVADLPADFDPAAPLRRAPVPWAALPAPDVRAGPPFAMTEMIAAEPALAHRLVTRLRADGSAASLARAVRAAVAAGNPVVVTGCGTSEHGAQGVARILAAACRAAGLPGGALIAAQAFELALDPPPAGLVIGVSHEGGTAATIAALDAARAAGGLTALITASAGSPAAPAADVVLETLELDASWCHTVGYVSPLLAAAATAEAIAAGDDWDATRLGAVLAGRLAGGISAAADGRAAGIAAQLARVDHLLVVGSGADIPAARELALKVEEAAWLPTSVRELETLLHGHLPATGEGTGLVMLLTDPGGRTARTARAAQALEAAAVLGIKVAAVLAEGVAKSIPARLTPAGRIVVAEALALSGPVAALFGTATPLQCITERLARARGTNPDLIRREDPRYRAASDAADT